MILQPTGGGSTIPSQSSSFKWIPQQVARLSGQSGTIYILAQSELTLPDDIEVSNLLSSLLCSQNVILPRLAI